MRARSVAMSPHMASIARALTGLLDEVASLRARVSELEQTKAPAAPGGMPLGEAEPEVAGCERLS